MIPALLLLSVSPYTGTYTGWIGPRYTLVTAQISATNQIAATVGGVPYRGEIKDGRIRFAWVDNRFNWDGRRLTTAGVPYCVLVRR